MPPSGVVEALYVLEDRRPHRLPCGPQDPVKQLRLQRSGAARIEWRGTVDLNADELLNVSQGELARAKAWLIDKLKNGPVLATVIEKQAREANISESTLKRAKAKLSVQSKKDGPNGEWRWHLVQEVQEDLEGQGSQEGQGARDNQDDEGTETDCECGGRGCVECWKQELPFDTT